MEMSRNRALYFPYINVPTIPWFTQALLYWDKVLTIVPETFDEHFSVSAYTKEVIGQGLVESLHPAALIYALPNFERSFLQLLDSRGQQFSARRGAAKPE